MRVLVTGSRDWEDEALVQRTLSLLHQQGGTEVPLLPLDAQVRFDGRIHVLVTGKCPTGADRMAEEWAEAYDVEVVTYPADWGKHGKAAGPVRNAVMVKQGADVCMAYGGRCTKKRCDRGTHPHCSHGTLHCASLAVDALIPTAMHRHGW